MSVSKEGKEYCMHNLVSMVIGKLCLIYPQLSADELLFTFSKSKTYRKLFNPETRLWAEGPDYILGLYAEEKGVKLKYLEDN